MFCIICRNESTINCGVLGYECNVLHAVWAVKRLLKSLARLHEVGHLPVLNVGIRHGTSCDQFPQEYTERPLNANTMPTFNTATNTIHSHTAVVYSFQCPRVFTDFPTKFCRPRLPPEHFSVSKVRVNCGGGRRGGEEGVSLKARDMGYGESNNFPE